MDYKLANFTDFAGVLAGKFTEFSTDFSKRVNFLAKIMGKFTDFVNFLAKISQISAKILHKFTRFQTFFQANQKPQTIKFIKIHTFSANNFQTLINSNTKENYGYFTL